MGQRGEIFTTRLYVDEGRKTYFFNIKENRLGDLFLNLVQSRKSDNRPFRRSSLLIYREDFPLFYETLKTALDSFDDSPGAFLPEEALSREISSVSGRRRYRLFYPLNKAGLPQKYLVILEQNERDLRVIDRDELRVSIIDKEPFLEKIEKIRSILESRTQAKSPSASPGAAGRSPKFYRKRPPAPAPEKNPAEE